MVIRRIVPPIVAALVLGGGTSLSIYCTYEAKAHLNPPSVDGKIPDWYIVALDAPHLAEEPDRTVIDEYVLSTSRQLLLQARRETINSNYVPDPNTHGRCITRGNFDKSGHFYRRTIQGFSARLSPAGLKVVGADPRVRYIQPNKIMTY